MEQLLIALYAFAEIITLLALAHAIVFIILFFIHIKRIISFIKVIVKKFSTWIEEGQPIILPSNIL